MSMYGAAFLKRAAEELAIEEDDPPDMQFVQGGYLFLATPSGEEILRENHNVQLSCQANISILTPSELHSTFPWLNTDGIACGALGRENEGWFDPWSLMSALRRKSIALGVEYIPGNVQRLNVNADKDDTVDSVEWMGADNKTKCLNTGIVINAAGAWATKLVPDLPVERRQRSIFVFHCDDERIYTGASASPLVVDPADGVYFRREGNAGHFICGVSPPAEDDVAAESDDVLDCPDHQIFDELIWPTLAERVPSFDAIKVVNAWSGFYAYNTFDQNAIIGQHDRFSNLYLANGFSGHGLQQAPAVGRAIAELIIDGQFTTTDLSCFSFSRIGKNEPVLERNIV